MSKRNNFFGSKSSYTARTIAFLSATGITDTTIANALNTMDLSLISSGLDVLIEALYPYVGGTATTHKYNFMNPADTDAAYRITWAGGITHDANGVTGNGSTGKGDTHWAATAGNLYDRSFSFYMRTITLAETQWSGVFTGGRVFGVNITKGTPPSIAGHGLNSLTAYGYNMNYGFLGASVHSSAANDAFYVNNGATLFTATSGATPVTGNAWTLALNGVGFFSSRNYGFEHYGKGMTSAQLISLGTIVQTFNTALSRNV